jgi:small subunit ribosomal protein S6
MERRLRVTEPVIKFLTVRVDKEQARLAKLKERRKAPPPPPETGGEPAAVTA